MINKKTIKNTWFWRLLQVLFVFTILMIFILPIFSTYFIIVEERPSFLEKKITSENVFLKEEYLERFRNKNPELAMYSDYEIIRAVKEKRPEIVILDGKELSMFKVVPFYILLYSFTVCISLGLLFLARYIFYYIFFGTFKI